MIQLNIQKRFFQACALALSNDSSRYILQGFNLRADKRGLYITATNGKYLISCRIEDWTSGEGFNVVLKPYIHAAAKHEVKLQLDLERRTARYIGGLEPTFDLVDGSYPKWEQVIPTGDNPLAASYNPELLSTLIRAAAIAKPPKSNGGTTVHMNGDNACVVLNEECPEFIGVLMPVKNANRKTLVEATLPFRS